MPAIYLFQRRTLYGGDDLHVLALVTGAARFFQLCCYSVLVYHIVHNVQHNMNLQDDNTTDNNSDQSLLLLWNSYDGSDGMEQSTGFVGPQLPQSSSSSIVRNMGVSLLEEYAWMDSANSQSNADCRNSHLFPLLLMSYTAAGIVFCVASCVLLVHIYRTSSQGCPTLHRHPRTETMEQLLEWLFLPLNGLHFLVWMLGVVALLMAYTYFPCDNNDNSQNNEDYRSPSTAFTVVWILCAILCLLSQAVEIFWNVSYVLALYQHDPHALHWAANNSNNNNNSGNSESLQSYHHSSSNSLNGMLDNNNNNNNNNMPLQDIMGDDGNINNHELVEQMWADRCQNWCQWLGMGTCYAFGGRELYASGGMHYGDFARAMADYLETRGVLDVVPSDIITGFLVLQQIQIQRRHSQRKEVISEHSKINLMAGTSVAYGLSSPPTPPQSFRGPQQPPSSLSPIREQNSSKNSSPNLHNRRANANGNSPNGMRLQANQNISSSSNSGEAIDMVGVTDALLQPMPSQSQLNSNQERSVRMLSMGTGNMAHEASCASNNIGDATNSQTAMNSNAANSSAYGTGSQSNNGSNISSMHDSGVRFDHSCPPPKKSQSSKSFGSDASNSINSEPPNRFRGFQRVLSDQNHADVLLLQEGARYSKYALCIYTWYLYLFVNPVTGIPKLCAKSWNTKNCSCCFSRSRSSGSSTGMHTSNSSGSLQHSTPATNNSGSDGGNDGPRVSHSHGHGSRWEGDNICQAHKNALLLTAGLQDEADLVYVQLKSSFNENPYCILVDHEMQAVVVAIRGTFSLEDCVTDVLLEPRSLDSLGEEFGFAEIAKGQHCHGGVMACARNVYRDLKRHGSLEYLLGTKYPHYHLRLVGHSLGAACSTLLGFMLRQTYPSLKCFNFSPPGSTLSWDLAIHCQVWCTSFVLDTEVVPRMSFEALENLRDEVLDLIGRIRVSKIEVARRVAKKTLWCEGKEDAPHARARHEYDIEQAAASVEDLDDLLRDLLLPLDEVPPDESGNSYRQQLSQFQAVQSNRRSTRGTRRAVRLFPPGRILHLVKTNQEQSCMVRVANVLTCFTTNAGSQYTPVWIGNGDLNEIVISPTMGTNHFPNRMVDELEGILDNFGLSQHFR